MVVVVVVVDVVVVVVDVVAKKKTKITCYLILKNKHNIGTVFFFGEAPKILCPLNIKFFQKHALTPQNIRF